MDINKQIELVSRLVQEDPYEKWTYAGDFMENPASYYTDPARLAQEQEYLFRNKPLFVGLSSEISKPGEYLNMTLGGIPISIIRQKDGGLKAVVNICRHRGATLLEERRGKARRLVCPYHAWTYDTDGKLLDQPHSDGGFEGINGNCNLHARAVAEKHGLIFVRAGSSEPFEVDDQLWGMQKEFGTYGFETAHHFETRETTWDMNWKLLIDTFMESYHVRYLHRKTIDPTFLSFQLYDNFGPNPRPIGLRRSVEDQLTSTPREEWRLFPHGAAVYVLWPNALLFYQGDHVETWLVEPISANKTRVLTSIYAPEEPASEKARNYWKKNLDLLCAATMGEDFPCQEQIQKNLESGTLSSVYYGRNEPSLVQFHKAINDAIAEATAKAA